MGALVLAAMLLVCMGIVYPIGGVVYYKLIKHSNKSISEILDEL